MLELPPTRLPLPYDADRPSAPAVVASTTHPTGHSGGHPGGHPAVTRRLRAHFLAGVLVTAPIGITIYLSWMVVNFIDSTVGGLIPAPYNPEVYLPFTIPGLGVVMVVATLILIGTFAAGYIGRLVLRLGESLVDRMPVVRNIYGAIKQIFETVLANQSTAFRDVVLVEYPRLGIWSLGFITGPAHPQIQALAAEGGADEVVNVFVPTTPIPSSGFLLFVRRKDVVRLDMTVEDGLKMVVSGGIVLPPDPARADKKAPRSPDPPHFGPSRNSGKTAEPGDGTDAGSLGRR